MNNELIVAWKKSIHLISVDYLFVGKILLYIIHPLLNKIYPTCDPDMVCGDLLAAAVHPAVQYSMVQYRVWYTVHSTCSTRCPCPPSRGWTPWARTRECPGGSWPTYWLTREKYLETCQKYLPGWVYEGRGAELGGVDRHPGVLDGGEGGAGPGQQQLGSRSII